MTHARGAWTKAGIAAVVVLVLASAAWKLWGGTDTHSGETARLPESGPMAADGASDQAPQIPDASGEEPLPRASVTGVVRDESGAPIEGATVSVSLGGLTGRLARAAGSARVQAEGGTTDPEGEYALTMAAMDGEFTFRADANGYLPEWRRATVSPEAEQQVDFKLKVAGSLEGVVADPQGRPVKDAVVCALWRSGNCRASPKTSEPTGQDGAFRIDTLRDGTFELTVAILGASISPDRRELILPAGREEPIETIKLRAGQHLENIRLVVPWDPALALEGIVVDDRDTPVPDARVSVRGVGDRILGAAAEATGATGRFAVALSEDVLEGQARVQVFVECPGFEPVVEKHVAVGAKGLKIGLRRLRRGTIEGVVLDAGTRMPIREARVVLGQVSSPQGARWRSDTKEMQRVLSGGQGSASWWSGRFKIADVRAGAASLMVYAPEYGTAIKEGIMVRPDEATEVEILLERAGELEVEVEYAGALAAGAVKCEWTTVWCWPSGQVGSGLGVNQQLEGSLTNQETVTGPGTRRFTLQPGLYDIGVYTSLRAAEGRPLSISKNWELAHPGVEVRAGETARVSIEVGQTGALRVFSPIRDGEKSVRLVLYPGAGTPAVDCMAEVTDFDEQMDLLAATGGVRIGFLSREVGQEEMTMECVPPGEYCLTVFAKWPSDGVYHKRESVQVVIEPGAETLVEL